jgi:hypothetical protein
LPDFSWYIIPKQEIINQMTIKYRKWPYNIPNGNKIYKMAMKSSIFLQDPKIFSQIGISDNPVYDNYGQMFLRFKSTNSPIYLIDGD